MLATTCAQRCFLTSSSVFKFHLWRHGTWSVSGITSSLFEGASSTCCSHGRRAKVLADAARWRCPETPPKWRGLRFLSSLEVWLPLSALFLCNGPVKPSAAIMCCQWLRRRIVWVPAGLLLSCRSCCLRRVDLPFQNKEKIKTILF